MVGTVEQIRKEIAALESATATLAENFKSLYDSYLETLGKAARRQLILAGYHLCTQAYPEAFLRLSLSQRQKLQEALRNLGDEVQNRLQTLPEASLENLQNALLLAEAAAKTEAKAAEPEPKSEAESPETVEDAEDADAAELSTADLAELAELAAASVGGEAASEASEPANNGDAEDEAEERLLTDMPMVRAMLMNAVLEAIDPDLSEPDGDNQPMTPSRLMRRHVLLEQRIRVVLQRISNGANSLLQKAQMLPDLPEALLAAATEADIPMEKATAPNLLNVLVEIREGKEPEREHRNAKGLKASVEEDPEDEDDDDDDDDSSDERDMTHLVAIHLRLSDIEFADAQSALGRSRLREAVGKLKQLGSRYQKKQHELAIAEAEQAWRATWYDEAARADRPSDTSRTRSLDSENSDPESPETGPE